MLRKIHFRDEAELLATDNDYMLHCMVTDDPERPGKKILHDTEDLEEYVQEYGTRHMFQ